MKRPAFQFYPADWRKDPALSACSLAARGLWIELICIAHESEKYGYLTINGKAMNDTQLARLVGESPKELAKLLAELEQSSVFSRDERGAIFSRRMVKDEHIRKVRAEAGRLGGNPDLIDKKDKQIARDLLKQNGEQIITPSSSSSTSVNTPLTPKGEKLPAVQFKTFLADCKARDEKPISDYRPVFAFAESVGLPLDFVQLAWFEFRRVHDDGGTKQGKRQADWRKTFRNYVEGNYLKLWWIKPEGGYELTTLGRQAMVANAERLAA